MKNKHKYALHVELMFRACKKQSLHLNSLTQKLLLVAHCPELFGDVEETSSQRCHMWIHV